MWFRVRLRQGRRRYRLPRVRRNDTEMMTGIESAWADYAAGKLTPPAIASKYGVTRTKLYEWLKLPGAPPHRHRYGPKLQPLAERFWEKVDRRGSDECWPWLASLDAYGYGQIYGGPLSPTNRKAHQVAYEINVGPIPSGLELDHTCRNPACVNPAHLEPVTHRENGLRGVGVGARNARKNHCPKGHPYDLVNTAFNKRGRRCRTCKKLRRAA